MPAAPAIAGALNGDDASTRAEISQRIDHYQKRAERIKIVLEEIEPR